MAFNPSGTSNGTIMGNAELLKGDIAVSNITSNTVSLSQNTIQGHPLSLGVPGKKHRHDDEEQGNKEDNSVFQLKSDFNVIKMTEDSYEGAIVLKPGITAPTGAIFVTFKYYEHGTGNYFSAESYPDYENIPEFNSIFRSTFHPTFRVTENITKQKRWHNKNHETKALPGAPR